MANQPFLAAPTHALMLVSEDRAHPFFPGGDHSPSNNIRGYYEECCCGLRPGTGPNVPPHWYDGGKGWVTRHFVDIEPFNFNSQAPGIHRCKYCQFEARGEDGCCGKGSCWCPVASAPGMMERHLVDAHRIAPPPKRQWASGLCDTVGCCEVLLCWQCQAARQINASRGWANQMNCFWCLYFTLSAGQHHDEFGNKVNVGCCVLAAWLNRNAIRELHNIDENCCETVMYAACCPLCSLAQTYREFSAGGVWPGGILAGQEPPLIMMDQPPPHLMIGQPVTAPPMGGDGYQKLY